jgi:hypothetical protein
MLVLKVKEELQAGKTGGIIKSVSYFYYALQRRLEL